MPVERDYSKYHKSISQELETIKDRVHNLIGVAHWPSDGEHKEAVLRRVLRTHLPDSVLVGRGFVSFPEGDYVIDIDRDTSNQLDVLITDRNKPTLFKDGDFVIVTPDAVKAVVEVKTKLDRSGLKDALEKLAKNVSAIRKNGSEECRCGLFVYKTDGCRPSDKGVLKLLQEASYGQRESAVDWVAMGPRRFFRFWENAEQEVRGEVDGPAWHSYEIEGFAYAYFISNVVWGVSGGIPKSMSPAWFPIENGKESRRKWYCALADGQPREFRR